MNIYRELAKYALIIICISLMAYGALIFAAHPVFKEKHIKNDMRISGIKFFLLGAGALGFLWIFGGI